MNSISNYHLSFLYLLLCANVLMVSRSTAQPAPGSFGFGLQLGEPAGLSFKIHQGERMSPDILLAWDLNDFFFVNVHGIWEKPISSTRGLHYFYGPGLFLGFRERNNQLLFDSHDDLHLGISGTFGLNYYADQFEIYLRITPRLLLIRRTDGEVGGGLGFRYFL